MKHVAMLNSKSVHLSYDQRSITLCGVPIFADGELFNGIPVSRFGEVFRPATCGRCQRVLRSDLRIRLSNLSTNELEGLQDYLDELGRTG